MGCLSEDAQTIEIWLKHQSSSLNIIGMLNALLLCQRIRWIVDYSTTKSVLTPYANPSNPDVK